MARNSQDANKQVIVIGSSMAGLMAARALADLYEEVTLLERDAFPVDGQNRKGVPQGRHAHGILVRGLQIMEEYFPGLTVQMVERGADHGDISGLIRWHNEGGYHQPCDSGYDGISVSRPALEAAVRERVRALPNVQIVESCDVLGLTATPDNARVTGVRLIRRRAGSAEETLRADLVVDASGRGSRSPAWLETMGYERPKEDAVKIGVVYMTCTYRRRPEDIPGVNGIVVAATPPNRRAGVLLGLEGERWIATLAGYLGEEVPATADGMLAAAQALPAREIYEVLKTATPLSEPVLHKIPSNLRRRYERLSRFPEGFLVIGDALCSFNPIYAQGMTVAALESVALAECLAQGKDRLAERFFKKTARIIDVPWSTAVGNDLRFPEVEGPRSAMTSFINWYVSKLHRAAHHDAAVSVAFLKVVNMLESPPSILRPRIAWRVLRGNLGWGARRSAVAVTDLAEASSV